MAPPRIKGRAQRGGSIPGGYIWGRMPGAGPGDSQLLNVQHLRAFGVGGQNQAQAIAAAKAGFQFFAGGLLADHEVLGAGTWSRQVTFTDGDADTIVTALVAPTADADIEVWAPDEFAVPQQVGTIHFPAGVTTATVTWSGGSYVNPTGRVITLYAPTPADTTLADVTGYVTGEGA